MFGLKNRLSKVQFAKSFVYRKYFCQKTPYELIGGEKAVTLAVDNFYKKVLADPNVNEFFKTTNMVAQRRHQTNFITVALGGPNNYDGLDMRAAHKRFKLNDSHFDTIKRLLGETLLELKVDPALVQAVAKKIETYRDDVLNR